MWGEIPVLMCTWSLDPWKDSDKPYRSSLCSQSGIWSSHLKQQPFNNINQYRYVNNGFPSNLSYWIPSQNDLSLDIYTLHGLTIQTDCILFRPPIFFLHKMTHSLTILLKLHLLNCFFMMCYTRSNNNPYLL